MAWASGGTRAGGYVSRRDPDEVQKRAVLAMVVKALAGLHGASIAHCGLCPAAVQWYARDNAMKLSDLACAAEPAQATRVSAALRYAPPEVPNKPRSFDKYTLDLTMSPAGPSLLGNSLHPEPYNQPSCSVRRCAVLCSIMRGLLIVSRLPIGD